MKTLPSAHSNFEHIRLSNTYVCMTVGATSLQWTLIIGYLHLNNKVTQTIFSFDVSKV